jgi:hypothetical protein
MNEILVLICFVIVQNGVRLELILLSDRFIIAHAHFYNVEFENVFHRNTLNEIRVKQDIQWDYIF